MNSRRSLVGASGGKYQLIENGEIPKPKPGMILCKVAAVALNPADAKIIDYSAAPGSVGGQDFAGEVVEVGERVQRFKVGDRVCSFALGLNPDDKTIGAFSQYALAVEDLTCKIPSGMTFEAAATLGLAIGTAGLALCHGLGLPLHGTPARESLYVLVSGGATATGVVAIQLLRESGFKPIATCSPGNKDWLKSLGAIETFDYQSPTCGLDIRDYTDNTLGYVLDCVTTSETMAMCYQAIGSAGGRYTALDPTSLHIQYTRRDIYANWIVAFTLSGAPVKFAGVYGRPAMPEHRQFAAELYQMAESLIGKASLLPTRYEVRTGGLDAVVLGIEDMRKGQAKRGKLVYPIA